MIQIKRELISIDIESTGVDVKTDRIVELALVVLRPGDCFTRNTDWPRKCRRLNPDIPIPQVASNIHGITNAHVIDKPRFAQVATSLYGLLTDCDITGYNVRQFDVPLLSAEFARCNLKWPQPDQVIVDAYEIFRRKEPHTLERALKYYTSRGLGDEAHAADADALAALEVLIGQSTDYVPGDMSIGLDELNELARDPEWIDYQGKAKWIGDVPVINFGKWRGVPFEQVDPTYFEWVLKQDFPDDFQQLCRAAMAGKFPAREQS